MDPDENPLIGRTLLRMEPERRASYRTPRRCDHLTHNGRRDIFTGVPSEDKNVELLQGTLDLIVLRALSTMGPLHAYALATRLAQVSDHPPPLPHGSLYPALPRLA